MFFIVLQTARYRPTATITIRSSADWNQDIFGTYEAGEWQFTVTEMPNNPEIAFKFVLDRQYWMDGDNLTLSPTADQRYTFTDDTVRFTAQALVADSARKGRIEDDAVIRKYIVPSWGNRFYDFIIVGTGIGGGILADRLAEQGKSVLVLESGSYLFPVHAGNIPQKHALLGGPNLAKGIWSLWPDWQVVNHVNQGQGSDFQGAQGYYLGGRSLFWGAYSPRLASWEFDVWPTLVQDELPTRWYREAEQKLGVFQPNTTYQQQINAAFQSRFGQDYQIDTMPLAIDYSVPTRQSVPTGVFSTADLLLESMITDWPGRTKPTINLNHHVMQLETVNHRVTAVVARDLIGRIDRRFYANAVVLSAGTFDSARIALQSHLTDPYGLIGKGFTDHPIFFTHFAVPPSSPFYQPGSTAKLTLRYRSANPNQRRYLCIVDIGSEFSQTRYRDPDILKAYEQWKGDNMLAEIVFQLYAPLNEQNSVGIADPSEPIWPVHMEHCPVEAGELAEIEALKRDVIDFLGGVRLGTQPFRDDPINRASLGGVAHEAGTLRMGRTGVVDSFHKFLAYNNLFACDLSVLPCSPSANPTVTLAALALRLADHLQDRFR